MTMYHANNFVLSFLLNANILGRSAGIGIHLLQYFVPHDKALGLLVSHTYPAMSIRFSKICSNGSLWQFSEGTVPQYWRALTSG